MADPKSGSDRAFFVFFSIVLLFLFSSGLLILDSRILRLSLELSRRGSRITDLEQEVERLKQYHVDDKVEVTPWDSNPRQLKKEARH